MEELVPKMARRRDSYEGQSRRWVRFCRGCPHSAALCKKNRVAVLKKK